VDRIFDGITDFSELKELGSGEFLDRINMIKRMGRRPSLRRMSPQKIPLIWEIW
jgi:hypothetical protein